MKKFCIMAATAIFVASFVGCGKDEEKGSSIPTSPLTNNELSGILIGKSWFDVSKCTTIKVFVRLADDGGKVVIAEAPLTNAAFSVTLPEPPAEVLKTMEAAISRGISLSNKNVKYTTADISATVDINDDDEKSNATASFIYSKKKDATTTYEEYYYVDSDVVIAGAVAINENKTATLSMNLKKGWNVVTTIDGETSIEQKTGTRAEGLAWAMW